MPNGNGSAVDDFLGGVNEVKDDPFKQESEDPFATKEEVKSEEVEKIDAEEKEEKLPFHKDPKVQRFIEKEISKRLSEQKPTETERFVKDVQDSSGDDLSDVLIRIIGNDTPEKIAAVKDFKKVLTSLEEKGAQRALEQLERQAAEERSRDRKAIEELNNGFEAIEENFGVDLSSNTPTARKTRNEFVDFIKRVSPKNEDGQVTSFPDLEETFTLFQEMRTNKPQPTSRAKELSSRSLARSSDASTISKPSGNSWSDVERLFSKLSG